MGGEIVGGCGISPGRYSEDPNQGSGHEDENKCVNKVRAAECLGLADSQAWMTVRVRQETRIAYEFGPLFGDRWGSEG